MMPMKQAGLLILLAIFSFANITLAANNDSRMIIEVEADEEQAISVQKLHADVRGAAKLALPQLWHRIVPLSAHEQIPKKVKALRFLQRATPTAEGVTIIFHAKRVFAWLKKKNIPFIEQQPAWNLELQIVNAKGRAMKHSATMLSRFATKSSGLWGYSLQDTADSLVLNWQWLDNRQVLLTVRGTSALGEYSDMRQLSPGDPVTQLKPWLSEILIKARDSQIRPAISETQVASQPALPSTTPPLQTAPLSNDIYLLLSIERAASLPEQILFEEELRGDPRILDLSLKEVNRDARQYRLHLKAADDQWLVNWFKRRGLTLIATIEGWVAR